MGRRKQGRTEAKLAVKLWGTDASGKPFVDPVSTRNISAQGALLEGVQRQLKLGDAVGLTYQGQKARFRVTWVGDADSEEQGLVGVENAVPGQPLWDVPLPPSGPDTYLPIRAADRRRFPRFECKASVEVRLSSGSPVRGNLADLSLGGCYIEMMIPLPVSTQLDLVIWLENGKLATPGLVTSSHAGFGVGVKFIGMGKPERQMLEQYLAQQPAMRRPVTDRASKAGAGRS
ncbi:MAG TPA: PilZ domain-containing protein [Terriglobales bacterium]|nr:PilZ domain-containing protein [Terriglobales bacterium]